MEVMREMEMTEIEVMETVIIVEKEMSSNNNETE